MSNVKHTPGPWIAAPYSSKVGAPVVSASGRSIASVTYFPLDLEIFSNHHAESAANGKLIAAAPELLDIAKRILDRGYVSESIDEERSDHQALVAAIAKAEGRS